MLSHSQLLLTQEEIGIVVQKHLDKIIQNPKFEKTNSEIKKEVLELRDLINRYSTQEFPV